jgi:hypothetical protein
LLHGQSQRQPFQRQPELRSCTWADAAGGLGIFAEVIELLRPQGLSVEATVASNGQMNEQRERLDALAVIFVRLFLNAARECEFLVRSAEHGYATRIF